MGSLNFFFRFGSAVFAFVILMSGQAAFAATLSGVDVDRTTSLLSGTGALSSTANGISVSAFGPSVTDTSNGALLFPSITLDSNGIGAVSFTSLGFPPSVVLGGTVDDFRASSALVEVLFENTASGELFVVDLTSSIIIGSGLALNAPFFDPTTSISVYSAKVSNIAPIPVPAAGFLLASALLSVGCCKRRARRK